MSVLLSALFVVAGAACVAIIFFGLPGTWILLALAAAMEMLDARVLGVQAPVTTFGWWVIGGGAALAAAGEALEILSGVLGTKAGGGTRRGMWGAILGGLLGALVGTLIVFLPLLGTLVGALVGTFLGALWGEMTAARPALEGPDAVGGQRSARAALKPALAATVSRLLGTVAKTVIGAVVWIALSAALLY